MSKSIIYCRVSTKKQDDKDKISIIYQLKTCKDCLIKNFQNSESEIIKEIKSGDGKKQEKLLKFFNNKSKLKICKRIIVYDIDRFTRSYDFGKYWWGITNKYNIFLYVCKPYFHRIESEEFFEKLKQAEKEKNNLSDRIKTSLEYRKSLGGYVKSSIPYGFKKLKHPNNEKIYILQEDKREQLIISFIRDFRKINTTIDNINLKLKNILNVNFLNDPIILENNQDFTIMNSIIQPLSYKNILNLLKDYKITKRNKEWNLSSLKKIL